MDKCILINLSLFTLSQAIFIQDGNLTKIKRCKLEEIPSLALHLCEETGINTIKIAGSYEYGTQIAEKIRINEQMIYSENKINIEVI